MFLLFIRIILIWWLLTVVFRFIDKYMTEHRKSGEVQGPHQESHANGDLDSIDQYSGAIEDADFEEIDSRERR